MTLPSTKFMFTNRTHTKPTFLKKFTKTVTVLRKVYGFALSWAHAGLESDMSKRGRTGLYSAQRASFTWSQECLTELFVSPQEPADSREKGLSPKPILLFEHPSSSSASTGSTCQHPWRFLGLFIQLVCWIHRHISSSHRVLSSMYFLEIIDVYCPYSFALSIFLHFAIIC